MLTEKQVQEIQRTKRNFPYRIVFGVVDKNTNEFHVYAKTTKHIMNRLVREGHEVYTFDQ